MSNNITILGNLWINSLQKRIWGKKWNLSVLSCLLEDFICYKSALMIEKKNIIEIQVLFDAFYVKLSRIWLQDTFKDLKEKLTDFTCNSFSFLAC